LRDFTSFKTLGDDFNTADLWLAFGRFSDGGSQAFHCVRVDYFVETDSTGLQVLIVLKSVVAGGIVPMGRAVIFAEGGILLT
jgi:hypothetical protein